MSHVLLLLSLAAAVPSADEGAERPAYAIVVSRETYADAEWQRVVEELEKKHHPAAVVPYDGAVADALPALREQFPRLVCFVARPEEATREFVAQVHRLTRKLDDDVYADCRWGILTGFDAANALEIARTREPLVVRRAAAGTELALDKLEEGLWHCELVSGKFVRKAPGEAPREEQGPADSTAALAAALTDYRPQLFVTSGHATERDWQIGFRYRNGEFRSEAGKLFGLDTRGARHPIEAPEPKVYLAVGNCLMGHIDGPDAMALAWLNSAGVRQMAGYTVLTWYGYAGWGLLDYFVEQPGRYDLAEAFFVNQQALLHRLETYFPGAAAAELDENGRPARRPELTPQAREAGLTAQDALGLLYDRDVVAFYGDPGWEARLAPGACSYDQQLTEAEGVYTFTITPRLGERSFEPVNTNGSQRGGRPIVALLPHRVRNVRLVRGADLAPLVTDDFVLVPNPGKCDPERKYEVVFEAERGE